MSPPTSLKVYAYNVGFGDCFLLQFGYPDKTKKHVLIDFGSTRLPTLGRRRWWRSPSRSRSTARASSTWWS